MGLNHAGPFICGFFFLVVNITVLRLPLYLSGKESVCQCRRCKRHVFDPWIKMIPWRRKCQPAPVFLPGESHGQRSLVGYSPGGHKSQTHLSTYMHTTVLHSLRTWNHAYWGTTELKNPIQRDIPVSGQSGGTLHSPITICKTCMTTGLKERMYKNHKLYFEMLIIFVHWLEYSTKLIIY